jgi:hypothetical protein
VKALFVLVSLICGLGAWEVSADILGQLVADFDVARGHYQILEWGLPVSWRPEYNRLLRERYGIETRVIAGCVVSESLIAYAAGYNAVSTNAAKRKFGHDVFDRSNAEASRTWKSRPGLPLSTMPNLDHGNLLR